MPDATPATSTTSALTPAAKATAALLGAALVVAFIFTYLPTFHWMVERFNGVDSYYGHGYLVPLIFGYLLYRHRAQWLPEIGAVTRGGLILSASLFALAIVMNFLGHLLTIFFLSGLSFPVAVIAIGALLFNPRGLLKLWFPFLFLFFMIPLPNELLELVSTPLKTLVSKASVFTVDTFGIPVVLNGFEVNLRWGPLIVGNPCSGLRSLVSLSALAAIVAHLSPLRPAGRLVVFLMAIPTAILCNYGRITFLLFHADGYGLASVEPGTWAHDGSGYALFALALIALIACSRWMEKKWPSTES